MYGKKLKVKLIRGKKRQAKGWGEREGLGMRDINAYTYMIVSQQFENSDTHFIFLFQNIFCLT